MPKALRIGGKAVQCRCETCGALTILQNEAGRYRCSRCTREGLPAPLDLLRLEQDLRDLARMVLGLSSALAARAEECEFSAATAGRGPFRETCGPQLTEMWNARDASREEFERAHRLLGLADRLRVERAIFGELRRRDAWADAILRELGDGKRNIEAA